MEGLHFAAEGFDRPELVFAVTGACPPRPVTDSDELELKLLVLVVVAAEVSPLGGVRSGVIGDPRSALTLLVSCLLFSKCNDLRRSLSATVSCSRTCLICFNIVCPLQGEIMKGRSLKVSNFLYGLYSKERNREQ